MLLIMKPRVRQITVESCAVHETLALINVID